MGKNPNHSKYNSDDYSFATTTINITTVDWTPLNFKQTKRSWAMNKMLNVLKGAAFSFGKSLILSKLKNHEFRTFLITTINLKVDLPRLNEKQEEELITAVVDAACDFLLHK